MVSIASHVASLALALGTTQELPRDADEAQRPHASVSVADADQREDLAATAAETSALDVLCRLVSDDPEEVMRGLVAAKAARLAFYDPPVRRVLRSSAPSYVRAQAAVTLSELDWPASAQDLGVRLEALSAASFGADVDVGVAAVRALGRFALPQARKLLRLRLEGASGPVYDAALEAMAGLSSPDNVARLTVWLGAAAEEPRDEGVSSQWTLARAAGRLASAPDSPDAQRALDTLGRCVEPALVRPLVLFALRVGPYRLRTQALDVLSRRPLPGDASVLIGALDDSDPDIRRLVVQGLAHHRSPVVAEALAAKLLPWEQGAVLRAVAASLREQETEALCQSLIPVLRKARAYPQELALFLVRERQGKEALFAHVVAESVAPSQEGHAAILGVAAEVRREVLLPRISTDELLPKERAVALRALAEIDDPVVGRAVLALVRSDTDPMLIEAAGEALAEHPDDLVVPRVAQALVDADESRRQALYGLLVARHSPAATTLLADMIRTEPSEQRAIELLAAVAPREEPAIVAAKAARLDPAEPAAVQRAALEALEGALEPTLAPRYGALIRNGKERRPVAERALENLESLPDAVAAAELRLLVNDPRVPKPVRLRSIHALGARGSASDVEPLVALSTADDPDVRAAAKNALHALDSARFAPWDRRGRVPLVLASAGFGAALLTLVTEIGGSKDKIVVLGVTGGVLGVGTSYLLARHEDVSLGEAGYFATVGLWGTLGGYGIGRLSGLARKEALWVAMGGEVLGLTAGGFTLRAANFSPGDVVLTNAAAISWGVGLTSAAYLGRHGDGSSGVGPAFGAGALLATAPMVFASPYLTIDRAALFGIAVSMGLGAWVGAFAPYALFESDESKEGDVLAGIGLGQAVGLTGGLALSYFAELDRRSIRWAALGLGSGAALGGGLGLFNRNLEGRPTYALVEAGSLLGAGVMAWLGPKLAFRGTDVALVALMTAAGGVSGSGWAEDVIEDAQSLHGEKVINPTRKRWGGRLVGTSLGLYAGLLSSQLVDLTWGELTLTGVGTGTVGLLAGSLAMLAPSIEEESFSPLFSAGAAVGGIGTALLAPRLRFTSADAGLALTTATIAGGVSAWTPLYWRAEPKDVPDDEVRGGILFGATLGAVAATTLSQHYAVDAGRVRKIALGSVGGMAFGAGLGLVAPAIDDRATVALLQGGTVLGYAAAAVAERRSQYSAADKAHLLVVSAFGGWHGSLIPYLWRDDAGEAVPDREVQGGVLLGLSLGAFGSRLAVKAADHSGADVLEIALFDILGTAVGVGVWGLSNDTRRRRFLALDGAGFLCLLLGEMVSPYTRFSAEDQLLFMSLAAQGAVAGAGLPYLLGKDAPRDRERNAGLALGAGALGLFGIGLTQLVDYEADAVLEAMLTSGVSAGAGYGLVLAQKDSTEAGRIRGADAGLLAGMGLGLVASPHTEFSKDDHWWIVSATLLGGYLGSRVPIWRSGKAATVVAQQGGALSGASFGLLSAAAIAQAVELPGSWAGEAAAVSALSALTATGLSDAGTLRSVSQQGLLQGALALGGYTVGGLLAPHTTLRDSDLGTVAVFSALGAWHGALAPLALGTSRSDDTDTRERKGLGGGMAGAGMGAFVGLGASQLLHMRAEQNIALLGGSAAASMVGGGLGLLFDASLERRAQAVEASALVGLAAGLGFGPFVRLQSDDVPVVLLAGGWGAWHGAWLAEAFDEGGSQDPPGGVRREEKALGEQRRAGGTLAGVGLGVGAGLALAHAGQFTSDELAEATVAMAVGNLVGAGAGKLSLATRPQWVAMLQAGGVGGLALGLSLAEHSRFGDNDHVLVGLMGAIGAMHGALLRGLVEPLDEVSSEAAQGGAMLGAGVGLASGMLLSQSLQVERGDLAEIALATLAGDAVGVGLGLCAGAGDRATVALFEAGGILGAGLSLFAAENTEYDATDKLFLAYGAVYGAWLGGWTPRMWDGSGARRTGGAMLLGVGAGGLLGAVATQTLARDKGDANEIIIVSGLSNVMGAGLGLVASDDEYGFVPFMEAAGLLGTAVATAVAPETTIKATDAGLGTMAALYGLYQGAGLSMLAESSDRKVGGAMMFAGAAGAMLGTYLGPYIQLDATEILTLAAGSAWGVWLGAWTAAVLDQKGRGDDERSVFELGVGTTAVATDIALVATSIAISELVQMPPLRFAWVSIGGGAGLVLGLTASALSGEALTAREGVLYGSATGLLLGTVLTAFVDFAPGANGVEQRRPTTSGDVAARAGVLPEVDVWFPSVQVMPPVDREGAIYSTDPARYMLTVTGLYR